MDKSIVSRFFDSRCMYAYNSWNVKYIDYSILYIVIVILLPLDYCLSVGYRPICSLFSVLLKCFSVSVSVCFTSFCLCVLLDSLVYALQMHE